MDEEQVENHLQEDLHIKNSGYLDRKHYESHREHVIAGLCLYGDLFAAALGYALKEADLNDSLKIMRYWNHLCEQHAILYKAAEAKQTAIL